jgi:hypothetical protein
MVSKKFGFQVPEVLDLKIRLYAKQNGFTLSELFRAAIREYIHPRVGRVPIKSHRSLIPPPPPAVRIRSEFDEWQEKNIGVVIDFKKELAAKMKQRREIIENESIHTNTEK